MSDEMFDDLYDADEEESLEKILSALLDKRNIETKTDIDRPLKLVQLDILSYWLKNDKMKKSSKLIDLFVKMYMIYRVSKKRESRKEIIAALTDGLKQDRSITDKLTKVEERN